MLEDKQPGAQKKGLAAVATAFGFWGIVVVYWKLLPESNAFELICHRILWASILLLLTLKLRGKLGAFFTAFRDLEIVRLHLINGGLIALNWVCYVYAITHNQILQGSLAYFMVPILNTAMGYIILKEQLSKLQWAAIVLATIGVANEIIQFGKVPWLALVMAITFAIYGLNKTKSKLGPMTALAVETWLYTPFAIIGIIVFSCLGTASIHLNVAIDWFWMITMGLITVLPLVLFAYGTKRIQLTTVGVFQFIAPSIKFGLGVFLYGEDFPPSKLITFCFIWVALVVYLAYLFGAKRRTV